MSELMIESEELVKASEQFTAAGKDLQQILKNLDDTTGNVKDKWEGAAKQVFFKEYLELRQYMEGFSILLGQISKEMFAMAERYDKADS